MFIQLYHLVEYPPPLSLEVVTDRWQKWTELEVNEDDLRLDGQQRDHAMEIRHKTTCIVR